MNTTTVDRRQFVTDLARTGLLCGLTALGALLFWRRLRKGDCADLHACRRCAIYAACPTRRNRDRDSS